MTTVKIKPNKLSIVESYRFIQNPCAFFDRNIHRLKPWYLLNSGFYKINIFTEIEVFRHVLVTHESKYQKSRIYWQQLEKMLGPSLGTMEGEQWAWMRSLQTEYFTPQITKSYLPIFTEIKDNYLDQWEEAESLDDLIREFSKLNVTFILNILFNILRVSNPNYLAQIIRKGEETVAWRSKYPWRPLQASLNGRNQNYKESKKYFDNFASKLIEQNMNEGPTEKLIDALVHTGKEGIELRKLIRNELIVHIGASTETTAIVEGWVIYLLHQNPSKLAKLQAEVDSIADKDLNPDHIPKLSYTACAINEAMRLFPPSHAFLRDSVSHDRVYDHDIQSDEIMLMSIYAVHRNPKYWENPEEFIPERFEGKNVNKLNFLPYGLGKHTCIGKHVSFPTMVLGIASFIKRFDFKITNILQIKAKPISTLRPSKKMKMVLRKRIK